MTKETAAQSQEATTRLAGTVKNIAPIITSWLEHQRVLQDIPGLQLAIRVGDELVVSQALGMADRTNSIALSTEHMFRIASHSKTFAATVVMSLVQDKKLRLDDTVGQWISELSDAEIANATVRELLAHQSGINRDSSDSDFWQIEKPFPNRDALIDIAKEPGRGVIYPRNQHFKYSNVGYGLLALIIEAATGNTFENEVRTRICEPLELKHLRVDYDETDDKAHARGHSPKLFDGDQQWTYPHVKANALAAATGVSANAETLSKYATLHYFDNDTVLDDDSKRIMQRDESVIQFEGRELGRYGVGMQVSPVGQRRLVGHSGGYPGFITRTFIDPTDKLVICLLTNVAQSMATPLAEGVSKLIDLAVKLEAEKTPAPQGVVLSSFEGRFMSDWKVSEVRAIGNQLVRFYSNSMDLTYLYETLEVIDADTLSQKGRAGFMEVGELITYQRDSQGAISSVRFGGGTALPVEKYFEQRTQRMERLTKG